jgi:hypothetical protein
MTGGFACPFIDEGKERSICSFVLYRESIKPAGVTVELDDPEPAGSRFVEQRQKKLARPDDLVAAPLANFIWYKLKTLEQKGIPTRSGPMPAESDRNGFQPIRWE